MLLAFTVSNEMKTGPKYKIARRLGVPIFEKTQTQKFTLSLAKKSNRRSTGKKHRFQTTEYGRQLLEKQKARYSYLLNEKQFSNYVKKALANPRKSEYLFELLESRLDNVVFRMGMAPTRDAAKQMVSHGHITVNKKRVTIPSQSVKVEDKIAPREQSLGKKIFADIDERLKNLTHPSWMEFNHLKKEALIKSKPNLDKNENLLFDVETVLEFYSR